MPIRLLPATLEHLEAYAEHPDRLSALLGQPLPAGWPQFPEALPATLGILRDRPDEHRWWMYFFLDATTGALVGSGGFAGPPTDGAVEIGYEIAPAHRRRGHASAAAAALVALALDAGVERITAHTLAGDPASAGVLRRTGFRLMGTVEDPEHGAIDEWSLTRSDEEDGDAPRDRR